MIYTLGYSKWTVEQVKEKMDEKGIDFLVDVRSVPFFTPGSIRPSTAPTFSAS